MPCHVCRCNYFPFLYLSYPLSSLLSFAHSSSHIHTHTAHLLLTHYSPLSSLIHFFLIPIPSRYPCNLPTNEVVFFFASKEECLFPFCFPRKFPSRSVLNEVTVWRSHAFYPIPSLFFRSHSWFIIIIHINPTQRQRIIAHAIFETCLPCLSVPAHVPVPDSPSLSTHPI